MNYLIVVAHPDDEVLGAAGIMAKASSEGHKVHTAILSANVEERTKRPSSQELFEDIHKAHRLLGCENPILGSFPNIRLNNVDHIDLVKFIENAIVETGAQVILTHHPSDLNNDHVQVSLACQAAARYFQRREKIPTLQGLYFMEILSATDWALSKNQSPFIADTFLELGEEGLQKKIAALGSYRSVMRAFPHPRCEEVLRGHAAYRGAQANMKYAEAYQTAFQVLGM